MKNKNHNLKLMFECFFVFLITALILLFLFIINHYAPFGPNTLSAYDANIQYRDFYAYFKDVLKGSNNISYTFGKTLGGTNIAVFSYYLASPLNLLVYFFPKTEIPSFFDLLVLIKAGIASMTMCIFLKKRFTQDCFGRLQHSIVFLLSICYGLCQYNIAQSSNIMWMDGVCFLPLISLGVYKIVKKRSSLLFTVSVGTAILFNWYSGFIDCIFSFFIWILEAALHSVSDNQKMSKKYYINNFFVYGLSMVQGIALSACLLLPTLSALRNSSRGSLNWKNIFDLKFYGNIAAVIEGYALGGKSEENGIVSLFCGSLTMIGVLSLILDKKINQKIKNIWSVFLVLNLLLYHWHPFFVLFSLLDNASSYWFRYSYVSIFYLIFMASYFFLQLEKHEKQSNVFKSGVIFAFVLIVINYVGSGKNSSNVQYTGMFMIITGLCLYVSYVYLKNKKNLFPAVFALFFVVLSECIYGTYLQMNNYHDIDADSYRNYVLSTRRQINDIKNTDKNFYRISQTSTRNTDEYGLTAYYNEALAYNYWSISGYTSSPDDIQRRLLNRLGYPINGINMCIVDTSIIGSDSLLGVKYVLSKYPINGYLLEQNGRDYNGKYTYKNPFALPMAFTYNRNDEILADTNNTFVNQNLIYKKLLGENADIYVPIKYTRSVDSSKKIIYTLDIPVGNYALYGNLPWNNWFNGIVRINENYKIGYAQWLSPTVFYIPNEENSDEITITISSSNDVKVRFGEEQFYALDLNKFAEITETIKRREAADIDIKNGKVRISVNSDKDEMLFVSIPYDKGWTIKLNGNIITPDLFADSLYTIPLDQGHNNIEMDYMVPYLKEGIILSLLSLIIIVSIQKVHRHL